MYVNAAVQFYFYSNSGNVGVAAALTGIQKVRDGEHLGAEPTAVEDVFSAIGTQPGVNAPSANLGF